MKKQIRNRFLILLGVFAFTVLFSLPASHVTSYLGDNALTQKLSEYKIRLGLDLAGGTELDYKIDLSDALAQNADDDPQNDVDIQMIAESVRDSLESRVNPAGIGEIIVQRSQVDDEEHVIIQMPPTANVEAAKKDAEKDNRLEFFEEMPGKLEAKRSVLNASIADIQSSDWDTVTSEILLADETASVETFGPYFSGEILDPLLADTIKNFDAVGLIPSVVDTQTEMKTSFSEEGTLQIIAYPEPIIALVYVKDITEAEREKTVEASANARHILFGYNDTQSAENAHYATAEEAKIEAEKVLAQLQSSEEDLFEELARQYSTEPAAQETGGNLGVFEPGAMVPAFNDAVFNASDIGLIPELVKTDFGYHIIDVLEKTEPTTETILEKKYTYEMISWKTDQFVWEQTNLNGTHLENAVSGYNDLGQYLVNLLFNEEGGELFAGITERVSSRTCEGGPCRLGIKVGGSWITQPTVRQKIVGRMSQISGNFTAESARELANDLNLGAIDAPVILSGQVTITPELGANQLSLSLKAGLYGFLATMIFMILAYRFAGVIAVFSLTLYALLFVTILKLWPESFGGPIVLTLSGIAGVILSIGLAVDGNILIFERISEELKNGKSLSKAIDLGFERAWSAIRDSNLTTLLTCIILFSLGSSLIKGFAITLIVGTLLSLFTAVNVTRNLLRFILIMPISQKINLFHDSHTSSDNQ